jgi:A/G-specific adenine glycosylase
VIEPVETDRLAIDAVLVRKIIIEWGNENFRHFPWRATTNPYRILMSEVMLHRTQAKQVVPVYKQFIQTYPDTKDIVRGRKEDIKAILYPLGLHWRIDLIYEMANQLMSRFDGVVPRSKEDLLSLAGVSEYIAGAIRCFAWNLPEPILDTNTVRITGRLFGLDIKDSSRRNPKFIIITKKLVDPDNPRAFNYAQLDLADKVCTRKQEPNCLQCPLSQWCCYGNNAIKLNHKDRQND